MTRIHPMFRAVLVSLAFCAPALAAEPTTVVLFDPFAGEAPESIQIDTSGSMYITLALTGEVRRIDADGAQETLAYLPLHPEIIPCGNAFGLPILGGIALDHQGNIYVSLNSCDTDALGVWKVTQAGTATQLANLPGDAVPNGIAYRDGYVYVADTNRGQIWRVSTSTGAYDVWAEDDDLLTPFPDFFPGPNGLQFFHDELYVSVSDHFHIVAFPLLEDGSSGIPRVHATGVGMDDFAFDVKGNLYGTTDPFNTLVVVHPNGTHEVLLDYQDGLDGPSAAAFGRGEGDQKNLYITNAAFPFFSTTFRPSIMKLAIGIPGKPRP